MHIDIVPNRNSPPAVLLRESYREGGKVKKRTLTNLSPLPPEAIEAIRLVLKGKTLVDIDELFKTSRSQAFGHVEAVLEMARKLKIEALLDSKPSKNRNLIFALLIARVLAPASKLATHRDWLSNDLPSLLGFEGARDVDDLYEALDWLHERQERIEQRLAKRHLSEGGFALFDTTSSYVEGECNELASRGHNRDKKKGKLQVNYGLLADSAGRPIALSVFPGNTSDSAAALPQIEKIRVSFGLKSIVLIGDRGTIGKRQIEEIQNYPGLSFITALKSSTIRKLLEDSTIQMGLFDERNLATITHSSLPGERLIVCRNPALAERRARKREELLAATLHDLSELQKKLLSGRSRSSQTLGVRIGRCIDRYKVAKHIRLEINELEGRFHFEIDQAKVEEESKLDGLYVLRTPIPQEELSEAETVEAYKSLAKVEQAFRCMKGYDLLIRPIFHFKDSRVRAHLFLCMLAYYIHWHLKDAWAPMLFKDEKGANREDPVAPAVPSEEARAKASTKTREDGSPVHSFKSLLKHLEGRRRESRRLVNQPESPEIVTLTEPTALQSEALKRIADYKV